MRDDEGDGFRRIVVGVDGSDGATRAVKVVARRVEGMARARTEMLEKQWCRALAQAGVRYPAETIEGEPKALIEVAESEDADAIVVGRRGRGGFAELVLGSQPSSRPPLAPTCHRRAVGAGLTSAGRGLASEGRRRQLHAGRCAGLVEERGVAKANASATTTFVLGVLAGRLVSATGSLPRAARGRPGDRRGCPDGDHDPRERCLRRLRGRPPELPAGDPGGRAGRRVRLRRGQLGRR